MSGDARRERTTRARVAEDDLAGLHRVREIAARADARPCRHGVGDRWDVDETYVKVAGRWRYVYRAIDQHGQIIDVGVSARRDTAAARRFFARAVSRRRY